MGCFCVDEGFRGLVLGVGVGGGGEVIQAEWCLRVYIFIA